MNAAALSGMLPALISGVPPEVRRAVVALAEIAEAARDGSPLLPSPAMADRCARIEEAAGLPPRLLAVYAVEFQGDAEVDDAALNVAAERLARSRKEKGLLMTIEEYAGPCADKVLLTYLLATLCAGNIAEIAEVFNAG